MNARFAVPVLFASSIGWGFTWLPIKTLNNMGLDSLHLIFIAFLSGAVLLSPWLYRHYSLWRNSFGMMIMIACAGGIANVSFQVAIFHGDVVRVMILFYLLPVWSVLGGKLFLNEKIDLLRWISMSACLIGAFLILDIWNTSWQAISWIDVMAISAGMGLAATNILFRSSSPEIPVISKVASTFIGCTILIGISLMIFPTPADLPTNGAIPLAILYGTLWLTVITIGTQWGVTQLQVGQSAIIIVMELLVAVASVSILTSKGLVTNELIGGVMVLSAALLEGARSD